ncbi:hypothetical protein AB5J62_32390 [Amycolatopsis sp. cg5]|uniref:hypothetical protein n=1 Tax=Amycolatopsis sp. cg5 TaxID=3238802 RepID=UPI003524BF7F
MSAVRRSAPALRCKTSCPTMTSALPWVLGFVLVLVALGNAPAAATLVALALVGGTIGLRPLPQVLLRPLTGQGVLP